MALQNGLKKDLDKKWGLNPPSLPELERDERGVFHYRLSLKLDNAFAMLPLDVIVHYMRGDRLQRNGRVLPYLRFFRVCMLFATIDDVDGRCCCEYMWSL
jgi:hypothetical protein